MPLSVSDPKAVHVVTLPPGSSFGPRQMTDWQILWFLEGDSVYERAGVKMEVPAGSLLFCVPGATERFWWDPKRPTRCVFAHFDILEWPQEWPPFLSWDCLRTAREGDVFTFGFRHLLSLCHEQPVDSLSLRLTLALMVATWLESPSPRTVPGREHPDVVRRALDWLHHALEEKPSRAIELKDLAAAACVSPPYLCRVFAASTGYSPMRTVMLARLDRALELVVHSELPLERIADICGLADPAHLSRRFRTAFGMTPLECRRRVREGHLAPEPRLTRHDVAL